MCVCSAARGQALCFWSESWLRARSAADAIVERVRSTRIATALEVDDGWQGNARRQPAAWADGVGSTCRCSSKSTPRGRVLMRIARRLRVTPFFAVVDGRCSSS